MDFGFLITQGFTLALGHKFEIRGLSYKWLLNQVLEARKAQSDGWNVQWNPS